MEPFYVLVITYGEKPGQWPEWAKLSTESGQTLLKVGIEGEERDVLRLCAGLSSEAAGYGAVVRAELFLEDRSVHCFFQAKTS